MPRLTAAVLVVALVAASPPRLTAQVAGLEAGAAACDITPPAGHPMWGYASRRDNPCEGALDPLRARALVLKRGAGKVALVSLDLGRAPTRDSMARIRAALKPDAVTEVFLVATHTHHGPVIELDNWPKGRPYVRDLEDKIVGVIRRADAARVPARYAVASGESALNRNRQSRRADAPVDRELLVMRVDDLAGKPIAAAVNFAAHPTTLPAGLMKFSADYPGEVARVVEAATGVPCLFLQGAAGDLSTSGPRDHEAFGKRLGEDVLKLLGDAQPPAATAAGLVARREELAFEARVDLANPFVRLALERAFFPALVDFFAAEYKAGVRPTVTVAVLDGAVGFAGVSGELFCEHALSLKRRARLPHLFVLGYCNDYHQYFPTIQAAAEGGYGTVPPVAAGELGAGERVTDRALVLLYQLRGMVP